MLGGLCIFSHAASFLFLFVRVLFVCLFVCLFVRLFVCLLVCLFFLVSLFVLCVRLLACLRASRCAQRLARNDILESGLSEDIRVRAPLAGCRCAVRAR